MSRFSLRFRHLLIVSVGACSLGALSAAAAAQDQAAPPPPAPVIHKHIAGVKYEDLKTSSAVETATVQLTESPDAPAQQVEVVGLSWGKLKDAGTVYSADPMEGGQVAKDAGTVYSADPMEGGQVVSGTSSANVAERKYAPGRPTYGNLVDDAPVMVSEPVAKGTASFKTLAGACNTGKHLNKVLIVTRSRSVTLHDATVISVTPADPVDGQAMEQVTLSYASMGD